MINYIINSSGQNTFLSSLFPHFYTELIATLHHETRNSGQDRFPDRPSAQTRVLQASNLRAKKAESARPNEDPAGGKLSDRLQAQRRQQQ